MIVFKDMQDVKWVLHNRDAGVTVLFVVFDVDGAGLRGGNVVLVNVELLTRPLAVGCCDAG